MERQIKGDMVTLSGENFQCYQVGVHYGSASELKDMAEHAEKLASHYKEQLTTLKTAIAEALPEHSPLHVTIQELPSLANAFDSMGVQLRMRAIAHSKAGRDKLMAITRSKVNTTSGSEVQTLRRWAYGMGAVLIVVVTNVLVYALSVGR